MYGKKMILLTNVFFVEQQLITSPIHWMSVIAFQKEPALVLSICRSLLRSIGGNLGCISPQTKPSGGFRYANVLQ